MDINNTTIKDTDLLDYVRDLINQRRTYYEPSWYADLHAYENNHFVSINPVNQTLQFQQNSNEPYMIQFPEVKKQVDGFHNLMMGSNPVYQVYPTDYADSNQQEEAKDQSLFLKQHFLDWSEDNILHSVVHNAGVLPVSFLELAVQKEFDIEENEWIHTTVPRSNDAFDIIFDARYIFSDNPCIAKVIRTTADAVAHNPLYKEYTEAKITSGMQDYKEIYYIDKFGTTNNRYSNRVLLYECYVKDGKDIKIVTIDGAGRTLRTSKIENMPMWPIVPFQPSNGNAYQPSILDNLLPMNRSMDLTGQRIQSMVFKHVRGQYLMPASTSIAFSDRDGTVVKYKGAVSPTVNPIPQIPEYAFTYFNSMPTMADRYGISSQVLGTPPKGSNVRSGKMMDKTQQGTLMQMKMYLDNFTHMLKLAAEVTVFLESKVLNKPRKTTLQSTNQEYKTRSFVGEDYYDAYKDKQGVVKLPKSFKKLTVEIEDESQHGIEAKRTTMERLLKLYPEVKQEAPELMPAFLALFLKTGDMASVMSDAEKGSTLLGSAAFQNLVENAMTGKMSSIPQVKQAISVLAAALANDPNLEKKDGGIPEGMVGKVPSQPAPSPATPAGTPPGQTTPVQSAPGADAVPPTNQPGGSNASK